jgi:hypothetical protein
MSELTRSTVDKLAEDLNEGDLAHRLRETLAGLEQRLVANPADYRLKERLRLLVAQLGDDLRMLRESRSGRTPSPPPAEGRPFQSRPDAAPDVIGRQLATLAEGTRMLIEEGELHGSALIPAGELGMLTQTQQLASMVLNAQAAEE